ncbi:hypothetical protein MKX08_006161 [Trichoderma sp. CBMAI-0020]|nr:hypothetical protein MKX08_006161 [Trichoderma sp. CBMAI-0020]
MASQTAPPPGVFVPVPTFFKPAADSNELVEPKVDIETQVAHSIYLAKAGITGLTILGSTGEAIHLSRKERSDLVAGVRAGLTKAGFENYPIMAGVLTNGISETLDWLEDYAAAGAQWGLVLAPGYFGKAVNQSNLIDWFTTIADRSPLPILIYNYPGVTNGLIAEPDTYRALAKHPKIVGCKMSHGDVSYHVQVSLDPQIDHSQFRVFSGFGQQLGPIVLFGAAGVIDGLAAFYPKTVVRLMKLANQASYQEDVLQEIRKLQFAVSRAEEFIVRSGIIGIREGIIRNTGLGALEGGRLPLKGRLPEANWTSLHQLYLSDIEQIEATL